MNKQRNLALPLLLLASFLLSLTFIPSVEKLYNDREFFRYAGMAILKGQVPYRDFFDHKPPLIFFINAFGLLFGRWGLWVIDAGMVLLVTERLYRRSEQYKIALPWLLPLLFNLMLRDYLVSMGINMTREYTTFFVLLFFCVLLGKDRYKYFWMGLLTGLTFFVQQDQVMMLAPFVGYALLVPDTVKVPARMLRMAGGFGVVVVPIVVYFGLNKALDSFWQDGFAFNFSVYTKVKKSLPDHFRTIKRVLDEGNYELPFLASAVLGGFAAIKLSGRKKLLTLLSLSTLLLALTPELLGGRPNGYGKTDDFFYYFLPLSGAVIMVLFCVFAFSDEPFLSSKKAMWPYAFLLCASLAYTSLQHAARLERYDEDPVWKTSGYAWLKERRPKDFQLFIMGDDNYNSYYLDFGILAPTRWIYQHFWQIYPQWDKDGLELKKIGEDLLRHHTTWIYMDAEAPDRLINSQNREWWKNFLAKHYQQVVIDGKPSSVWQLKEGK